MRILNDVNARTRSSCSALSASKPKRKANKSVATPHKKTVASDTTIQKSKSYYKKLYEDTNQEWKWWIAKRCPSGYTWTQKPLRTKKIWMPKIRKDDVSSNISPTIDIVSRITNIVQLILFIVDSGCTKHVTGPIKAFVLIQGNSRINGFITSKANTIFSRWVNSVMQFGETTSSTPIVSGLKLHQLMHGYGIERLFSSETSITSPYSQRKKVVTGLPKLELYGVVERRNRTLVEAARTMLSASKLPLSFWAEAVATACYTQNRSIIISTHGKTAYHIINDRKPSIKHLHIFGCTCYITRDGENLDKMKEKGDPCVMVGYSTQSKGYRVYNKRTRLIVESIHIKFDEIKEMMSDHNSSDLAPQRQEMSVENVASGLVPQGQKASDYDNSDPPPPPPYPQDKNVVPTVEKTDSSQQGLEFLFSPLLEEYYNPTHGLAEENNNDQAPNASFQEDEFVNPFCTRRSSLKQVRGNPSMPVQTRRQLATDPEMCMFALTVSIVEPKNIKEAMADSAWIEAMQDELHQFDRLKVWELVDKPFGKMIIKLKWLWKNKKDEDQTLLAWKLFGFLLPTQHTSLSIYPDGRKNGILNGPLKESICQTTDHAGCLILGKALAEGYSSLVINFHKVVRLGINPMIQPEPEDLPKDNPKLEIAVLSSRKLCYQESYAISIVNLPETFESDYSFSNHNERWKSFQLSSSKQHCVGDLRDSIMNQACGQLDIRFGVVQ
ncbi:gag-pol polyprotein [Tanacetum coccineum]